MNHVGRARHLVSRFLGSLSPAPPSDEDRRFAESRLSPAEMACWRRMPNQDQRHSADVARRFLDRRPDATREEMAGALLHDVGKTASELGTIGRVAATLVGPRGARFRTYHDHERIGAEMMAEAGSAAATVALIGGRGPAAADLRASDDA